MNNQKPTVNAVVLKQLYDSLSCVIGANYYNWAFSRQEDPNYPIKRMPDDKRSNGLLFVDYLIDQWKLIFEISIEEQQKIRVLLANDLAGGLDGDFVLEDFAEPEQQLQIPPRDINDNELADTQRWEGSPEDNEWPVTQGHQPVLPGGLGRAMQGGLGGHMQGGLGGAMQGGAVPGELRNFRRDQSEQLDRAGSVSTLAEPSATTSDNNKSGPVVEDDEDESWSEWRLD